MGIFSRRKNMKHKKEFEPISIEEALSKYSESKSLDTIEVKSITNQVIEEAEVMKVANDCFCQVVEIEKQLADAKQEYSAVTMYLSDIQKVVALSLEEKEGVIDASRKILQLNKERNKYKSSERGISEAQFSYIDRLAKEVPKELHRMKEQETYQELIKSDIRQLEGEKGSLNYEREESIEKKEFLRKFSIVSCISVILIFMILFYLMETTKVNLMVPFFMTGMMALAAVLYIIIEARRSTYQLKMAERKLNRAVMLMNKVKIKYVNCTSTLDYAYEKYRVNSYQELYYLWTEYVKAKDATERYKKNTNLVDFYHQVIVEELMKFGIEDAAIWIHQPEALLDEKEMVEVRHRLNVRRQKLREHIDFNNKQRDIVKNQILAMMNQFPEKKQDLVKMSFQYRVEI